jgi:spore coat protein A
LEPFVDPLPIPPVLRAPAKSPNAQYHRITLSEFRQKVHRDLPPTLLWGFAGCTPGPTIEAVRGCPVTIDWLNRLPEHHRLLVDHTLDGAGEEVPEVRTTVHLHGGHVSPKDDGYPENWITRGQAQRTVYPNRQPGATLWYHDHAMGITRLNAMMGLAGVYVLRDPEENRLRFPSGSRDIPLVIQDRTFDAIGQIAYPVSGMPQCPSVPEFFGSHVMVNGRVSPYLDVEPHLYRFRFVNAANSRTFQLSLLPGQQLIQIGGDGGLLNQPVLRDELLIVPGERLDVLIDFRGREGRRLMLVNDAPAPFPSGGGMVPGWVMQFRVSRPLSVEAENAEIPETLATVARLREDSAVKTRRLQLMEVMAGDGQPHRALLDGKRFMDPISEDPQNGSIEIWEFVNMTADAHPIHLHAVHFQLLDRRPFAIRTEGGKSEIVWTAKPIEAPPHERGWKDTILCPPRQTTRIIIPFSGEPGKFVWHCHMLEHEDNEMMRPYLLRG